MKNSRDAVQFSPRRRLLQDQQAGHAASRKGPEPVRKEAQVQHEHDSAVGLVEQRVRRCRLFSIKLKRLVKLMYLF